jgi:predicted phage terminase large subunit-like protein
MDQTRLLDAICREDFASFIAKVFETLCPAESYAPNWHIDCLAWNLSRARGGARLRLILNLPPRSLKSLAASIALSAWLLGHDPTLRIIAVSYADSLAAKHARDFRTIVESAWYRRMFPAMRLNPRKNTETETTTTLHGFRLATSIGGTLTGRGGSVIIIDDPIKPADAESDAERRRVNEWYDTTLFSRLDDKGAGAVIVVMQRLHENDLTGHLLAKGGFDLLRLPAVAGEAETVQIGPDRWYRRSAGEALHPGREGPDILDGVRATVGSRVFHAQYQQSPVPAEGNLFKASWLKRYAVAPNLQPSDVLVQSWDTASKVGPNNDYSVCTTWLIRKEGYYLLEVRRGQWEFPDLLRIAIGHIEGRRAPTVLIEDANSGMALLQSIRQRGGSNVIGIKPRLEKFERAAQQSAVFEAGRVYLPEDAPWLAGFEAELLGFPNARHDDQVDSTVQFLQWAAERARYSIPIVGAIVISRPREFAG